MRYIQSRLQKCSDFLYENYSIVTESIFNTQLNTTSLSNFLSDKKTLTDFFVKILQRTGLVKSASDILIVDNGEINSSSFTYKPEIKNNIACIVTCSNIVFAFPKNDGISLLTNIPREVVGDITGTGISSVKVLVGKGLNDIEAIVREKNVWDESYQPKEKSPMRPEVAKTDTFTLTGGVDRAIITLGELEMARTKRDIFSTNAQSLA